MSFFTYTAMTGAYRIRIDGYQQVHEEAKLVNGSTTLYTFTTALPTKKRQHYISIFTRGVM